MVGSTKWETRSKYVCLHYDCVMKSIVVELDIDNVVDINEICLKLFVGWKRT